MTKTETRTPEAVLAAIEDDLRRDERMWEQVHHDLRSLGVPRPRRTGWLVATAVGVLVLVAASFVLGRTTAPGPAPAEAPTVAEAATPFTATGLESKREGFVARYGSIWGWGPPVTTETAAARGAALIIPASSLESKREGFVARYGSIWGWGPAVTTETAAAPEQAPTTPANGFGDKREGLVARYGPVWG